MLPRAVAVGSIKAQAGTSVTDAVQRNYAPSPTGGRQRALHEGGWTRLGRVHFLSLRPRNSSSSLAKRARRVPIGSSTGSASCSAGSTAWRGGGAALAHIRSSHASKDECGRYFRVLS